MGTAYDSSAERAQSNPNYDAITLTQPGLGSAQKRTVPPPSLLRADSAQIAPQLYLRGPVMGADGDDGQDQGGG